MKTYPSWTDPRVVWKELNAFKNEIFLTESDHFYIALKFTIYINGCFVDSLLCFFFAI